MTARNVVSASAGAATATRLPTQVAARIAFLNAFIPSPPLSFQRPNASSSGALPGFSPDYRVDIQLHNTLLTRRHWRRRRSGRYQDSPPDRLFRGRLAPSAGWIAVPIQLRQHASSKTYNQK